MQLPEFLRRHLRPHLIAAEGGQIRTLRREAFRAATEILRGYDAGKRGRMTDGWITSGGSATSEITASLATIRNRARDLVRNNPYATRAIDILQAKKIGTGIRVQFREKGPKDAWNEFVETCDFEGDHDLYGLQSLVARAADESGEVLIRRIRTREGRVPLQLQVLEADYIDSAKYGAHGDNYIIAGIEIDRMGRRQALWLYDHHPGESNLTPRALESRRVPVSEIIHFYEKRRPGQMRGMSRLASAILRLRNLDDYKEAELVRKKIEACFAAFVTGGDPNKPLGASTQIDSQTGQRQEFLEPGQIVYLGTGEAVNFGNPGTTMDDSSFTDGELYAIAMACGVMYEQLTGNLKGTSFSSIRAGRQDFIDIIEKWRWIDFCPMAMRRIKDWFLDAAYVGGSTRTLRYPAEYTAPAWPYVNPKDDIDAILAEIDNGLQSRAEHIRQRGYDPDVVRQQIKEEREQDAKDGLKFGAAAKPAPAAPAAPRPADGEEPKAGDEPKGEAAE